MSNQALKSHNSAPNPSRRRAWVGGTALATVLAAGGVVYSDAHHGSESSWAAQQSEQLTAEGDTILASGTGNERIGLTERLHQNLGRVGLIYDGDDPHISFSIGEGANEHTLIVKQGVDGSVSADKQDGGLTASVITVSEASQDTQWVVYLDQSPTQSDN